jgi:hypothetical protein
VGLDAEAAERLNVIHKVLKEAGVTVSKQEIVSALVKDMARNVIVQGLPRY